MARRLNHAPAETPDQVVNPDWNDLLDQMLNLEGSLSNVYRRFWNYSTSNCAFLLMQGCPMEPIATFKGWQSVDRSVVRGASAFYIQRPIMVKTGEKDEETGEDKKIKRFKPVKSIFPISMTEGEPLPEIELPEWSKQRALGALSICEVAFESFDSNSQGYSFERSVAVNPAAVYPMKTFFHETGHIMLGHTTEEQQRTYHQERPHRELGAEAVAHIVSTELGFMTDEMRSVSRGYIAHWRGQADGDEELLSRRHVLDIFKASDLILEAGRPVVEEAEVAS